MKLELHLSDRDSRTLREIEASLREIAWLLRIHMLGSPATSFRLTQLTLVQSQGAHMAGITGVPLGGSGTLKAAPVAADGSTGALQAGAPIKFTTPDTSVTLAASPDGDATKIVATVAATEKLTSFGIVVSGVASDGTAISTTFTIPVLSLGPKPATGFTLEQTA